MSEHELRWINSIRREMFVVGRVGEPGDLIARNGFSHVEFFPSNDVWLGENTAIDSIIVVESDECKAPYLI